VLQHDRGRTVRVDPQDLVPVHVREPQRAVVPPGTFGERQAVDEDRSARHACILVETVSRPGGRGAARLRRGRSGLRRARVLARARAGRPVGSGNREQTADGPGDRAQARVKRCGKSAPASGVTPAARQPPPGARSSVGRPARSVASEATPATQSPGRPHRWMVTHPEPRKGPVDRIPPTGRLTVTPASATRSRHRPSARHEHHPSRRSGRRSWRTGS
jgi:hypothetical protein